MEAEAIRLPCDRPDCKKTTTRSPSVLPLALTEDRPTCSRSMWRLCQSVVLRPYVRAPRRALMARGVGYRSLTQGQADKVGIDWGYVRNRPLFLPRVSVCAWKATQARKARTEAADKAYECPVRGCERPDPLRPCFMCISLTPGRPNPIKTKPNGTDVTSQARRKWLDVGPTTRGCCGSCYNKAKRRIPSGGGPSTSFPSAVCSPCSPEEAPPLSNSREYWKLKTRDASMALASAKCEGNRLGSEIKRLKEAQKILVTCAGA